ncbi:MAG TPA: UTP--glucose-1-phosphate uridylyltransferase, partial [Opitutaceae bacterium]|nr:UTP--glucose-1-phosphate uridylyltransferase [Opitutaceae bacterium]
MDDGLLALVEGRDVTGTSFEQRCRAADRAGLEAMAEALEVYRRTAGNFYHRVRAVFFLAAIHRYFLPPHYPVETTGSIPYEGHRLALGRRFEEAVALYRAHQARAGTSDALSSALAAAYHGLAFKTLAQQVQKTVRSVRGNQWMFRTGHPLDYPLRLRNELVPRRGGDEPVPLLVEETAVRLDLSHSAWSDIFFLGMDYPEGAKVLNLSVNLGVHGRDQETRPPVCAFLRVIDEPVLRLVSVDLGVSADVSTLGEVFDFAKDYLGLLKAAVIASGLIPPGLEGSGHDLAAILQRLVGAGRGLEIV